MNIEERRLKVLEETIEYFKCNPRCLGYDDEGDYGMTAFAGSTLEVPVDGCAVGRLLTPSKRLELDQKYGEVPLLEIWGELPEDVIELGQDFMIQLCIMHDNCTYWTGRELSEEGLRIKNEIENNFCK